MEERLQKILAKMGIASRRGAEEIILEGRVTVNGQVAVLGTKADMSRDHIKLDGKLLTRPEPKVYLMINKPRGVITTLSEAEERPAIRDYLRKIKYRVFPVGRLDYDSEGLLLLTNDGDFTHAILHPSKKIPKTYHVKIKGLIEDDKIEKLKRGVKLEDGMTSPARLKKLRKTEENSWLEITIYEGKKRQVRRMFEKVGHSVLKLKRVRINGIELGNLPPGEIRYLTPEEVSKIKKEVVGRRNNEKR
ncbi:MAG: rRNA pseudouridine synthase [Nitrospirae bacterium]|nr:rRNA pseudouridine synthase [Nitrospirota bacterium]